MPALLRPLRSFVAPHRLQAGDTADRPVPLFNGRDLDGWTTWLVDSQHADPRGAEVPVGGWNRLGIESRADRVRVRLNGVLINEAGDAWPRRGHLLLQCEDSEIFFRRVEIQWP